MSADEQLCRAPEVVGREHRNNDAQAGQAKQEAHVRRTPVCADHPDSPSASLSWSAVPQVARLDSRHRRASILT